MLKDITIGQHFPGNSPVHTLDPRVKIIITVAYVVFLFMSTNLVGLALCAVLILSFYAVAKIPVKMLMKSLKPIIPIIIFTVVLNLFFISGEGQPLFAIWKIRVFKEGILFCIVMVARIICLISGTSLLTYTTSPIQLTDGLESLLKPLNAVHFPVHEMSMMMTIALRFIPTLVEETDKIMQAQKSRGAMLDSGSFTDRVKALVPILIPLFISAFRRADELATAMECRCYRGGAGRTRLKQLKITGKDIVSTLFCVVCFGIIYMTRFYFVGVL
ncbi:MAG: energy-coupling factor transporter transmembrane component T [Oscillospiraceae bacterium]